MADAAARREARRKRILENSQNRLLLISGKCSDDSLLESTSSSPIPPVFKQPIDKITTQSCLTKNSITNGRIGAEPEIVESLLTSHNTVGDRELTNDLSNPIPAAPQQVSTPFWATLITYKYDVVILSLLLQFMYSQCSMSFEDTYFFIPLLLYVMTKQVWFPKQNKSSIANVLMLLNGMSPNVHKVLYIFYQVSAISQDICVFLFTTICTQSFVIFLWDNSGTVRTQDQ